MKDIAIYGAGGLGREIACLLRIINEDRPTWNIVGFFDDQLPTGFDTGYGLVLGGMDKLNGWPSPLGIVIAIGSSRTVSAVVSRINSPHIEFPNIIAPGTLFLDQASLRMGKGNIIGVMSSISCNVHLGDFNLLNGRVALGHDVTIGDYNSIMPGVNISGDVKIGNYNFFGVSAVLLQRLKIGNGVTVGANSVIIRKPKDGMTYMGSPATIVKY